MIEGKFEGWAIIELMGHRKLAGLVREQEIAGQGLLRLDVPGDDGKTVATQFYHPNALYCLTPTTEEIARALAKRVQPEPVMRYGREQEKRLECGWCEDYIACRHVQAVKAYVAAGEPKTSSDSSTAREAPKPEPVESETCPARKAGHRWAILEACDHPIEFGRLGYAIECRDCKALGHRWTVVLPPQGKAPFAFWQIVELSQDDRAAAIAAERERCVVAQRQKVEVAA